jgi:glycosyltransferase involved in cell wall biosynthesis
MRLLVVTPEFPPHSGGGICSYYDLLCDALAQAGADVHVVVATPFSAYPDYQTPSGVKVSFIPLNRVEAHAARLSKFAAAPMFRRWIGAGLAAAERVQQIGSDFDVVETADFGLLFAPLVALADRPPLTIALHGSIGQIAEHEPAAPGMALDVELSRLAEAIMLPAAGRLVALSPLNAQEWSARLETPVKVSPPPFRVAAATASDSKGFTGIVAARIQSWKGPALLCEAIAELGSAAQGMKIAWAGRDTPTAPDGTSMAAWLGRTYPDVWGRYVIPIGSQPRAVIDSMLASVRCVVVPSTWDTFNYTIPEGMGAGSVVVASQRAGASFLIADGENGFVCDAAHSEALGETLLKAHRASEAERRAIGSAARTTVARELEPASVAQRALAEYRALSREPQPARPNPLVRRVFDTEPSGENAAAFLENVGIRDLAGHLGRRLARKVF